MADLHAALGSVDVGNGHPVAIMGVVNVSPESFYAGSVYRDDTDIVTTGVAMVQAGATLIDVGARSTAPYLATEITEAEEADRLVRAIRMLAATVPVPICADTTRPAVAEAALAAGATVLNDVSGLADPRLAEAAARHDAGLIAMAAPRAADRCADDPVATVSARLAEIVAAAGAVGVAARRLVLDPGIGFFRDTKLPWDEWDARVLAGLATLRRLGRPLCVGVSRKSFIGAITGRADPGHRLAGSLAAAALAVAAGAAVVRAHDVPETVDAVRVAERIRAGAP